MISNDSVTTSKEIQRETGRTFHLATRLLPRRVRRATYILYAFFRIADEVVDDSDGPPPAVQRQELERIQGAVLGDRPADDIVLQAVRDVIDEYEIDETEVMEFISAMKMDTTTDRYDTNADLDAYLRGSSVAVAYMLLSVMDIDDSDAKAARPHAKALGQAFQLTNFLRDVREDIQEYGRIYIPQETLSTYDISEEEIESATVTDEFGAMMRAELRRVEQRYRTGVAGIVYLPIDCQLPVLLAAVLYADHHRLIREQDYDVLTNRPDPSHIRQGELLLKTWYHWYRTGDPETVFYRVSEIPEATETDTESEPQRDDNQDYHISKRGLRLVVKPVRYMVRTIRSRIPSRL